MLENYILENHMEKFFFFSLPKLPEFCLLRNKSKYFKIEWSSFLWHLNVQGVQKRQQLFYKLPSPTP